MIPQAVETWLRENKFGPVQSTRPVSGGCISHGMIFTTQTGQTFFIKTNPNAPADMFAQEAEGLAALQVSGGPTVPRPYLHESDFILLEDLAPAPRRRDFWPDFGRKLATLHLNTNRQFGFAKHNYIGSTHQPNPWMEDGCQFFAEQRLLFQARLARERGLLSQSDLHRVENLAARLPDLVPNQPASLLHGDLWSGNAITNSNGSPTIIDPAAHYGWAEAELAMTALFGSFPSSFYQAYAEIRPLDPGYSTRYSIYNLYHLLNHLNIFGRGYLAQVQAILTQTA